MMCPLIFSRKEEEEAPVQPGPISPGKLSFFLFVLSGILVSSTSLSSAQVEDRSDGLLTNPPHRKTKTSARGRGERQFGM